MDINKIAEIANETAERNGFWDSYNFVINSPEFEDSEKTQQELVEAEIGKKLMLIVSEISEAMEARRNGKEAEIETYKFGMKDHESFNAYGFKTYIKNSFADELADAIIRIGDLAKKTGVDLAWHVEQKMKYNATRPYKHGKAY